MATPTWYDPNISPYQWFINEPGNYRLTENAEAAEEYGWLPIYTESGKPIDSWTDSYFNAPGIYIPGFDYSEDSRWYTAPELPPPPPPPVEEEIPDKIVETRNPIVTKPEPVLPTLEDTIPENINFDAIMNVIAFDPFYTQPTTDEVIAALMNTSQVPPYTLQEGYEWDVDPTAGVWVPKPVGIDLGEPEEMDFSVPDTVWQGMEDQINEWRTILNESLAGLNLDYSTQQAILNALTQKILNYEAPDLSAAYAEMDDILAQLQEMGTTEYTADTAEIERITALLEAAGNNEVVLDDAEIQRLISELEALAGQEINIDTSNLAAIRDQLLGIVGERANIDYTDINRILGLMEEGPNQDEAFEFVARSFGFGTAEEYFNWLAEQRGLTRADMQGLTDEEKAEYDRTMRLDMQEAERRSLAQMEAVFADTGSAIQYMAAADEANQRMVNTQLQYRTEQMNQDIMLQSQALEQQLEQYNQMVSQGQMSALQYMDMRQRGYESLLNGYLSKAQLELSEFQVGQQGNVSALTSALGGAEAAAGLDLEAAIASGQMNLDALTSALEGRQGYANLQLTESAQDLDALTQQFNSVYNSMMIQTGINSSILDAVDKAWETSMKPFMASIEALLAQENLSAQDEQLAFQYQALAVEEVNNFLQFTVGMADVGASILDIFF